jgi:hypothetical protein
MKRLGFVVVLFWAAFSAAAEPQNAPAKKLLTGKNLGWIFNNDNSSSWEALSGDDSTHEEFKNIVRQMLDTNPGVFAQCAGCIDPTCYPSKYATWGKKAEEYDREVRVAANTEDVNLGTSQEQERRKNIARKWREPGKDSISLTLEVCRERRIPMVISFRMAEGGSYWATLLKTDFSRGRPDLMMGWPMPGTQEIYVPGLGIMLGGQGWGLDRAIPEVYDHQMAIFKEAMEKFDVDGIEFDFKRYYPMISNPHVNYPVHTRMLREMRQFLDQLARKRGRGPMLLGVRVSYSIEGRMDPHLGWPGVDFNCKDLGLDVKTWIKEGIVDYVCPSYFHGRDLPGYPNTWEFTELARGTKVGVYPTTFARPRWPEKEKHPDNQKSWHRFRDEICSDALQMYADGADGVSTYNMGPGNYQNPKVYPPAHEIKIEGNFRRGSDTYNMIVGEVMKRLGSPQALREYMTQDLNLENK